MTPTFVWFTGKCLVSSFLTFFFTFFPDFVFLNSEKKWEETRHLWSPRDFVSRLSFHLEVHSVGNTCFLLLVSTLLSNLSWNRAKDKKLKHNLRRKLLLFPFDLCLLEMTSGEVVLLVESFHLLTFLSTLLLTLLSTSFMTQPKTTPGLLSNIFQPIKVSSQVWLSYKLLGPKTGEETFEKTTK